MPLEDNEYGLADIQRQLLDMMLEIDSVCRERLINYTLLGGSMLGAIREKGFIPWDDDLDIGFLEDDLERFIAVFPTMSDRYTVTRMETWVARVVPIGCGDGPHPFVDLFHYAPASASPVKRRIKVFTLKLLQGMLKEDTNYSGYPAKYRALLWGTHIMGLPFSKERKLRWYKSVSNKMFRGDGSLLHVPDGDYRVLGRVYPASWVRRLCDAEFEGARFMVCAHYDEMLTRQYGDYMTRPPENKRIAAHSRGV